MLSELWSRLSLTTSGIQVLGLDNSYLFIVTLFAVAVIEDITEDKYKVFFVGYGNTEEV
jgi:hypothetical protein